MNATPSRLGQVNQAGAVDVVFLKLFAGDVLNAYNTKQVTVGRHYMKTITQGKSAQFPATGRTTAAEHTPGAEITGNLINHAEKVISIDALIVSPVFVANIDEAMNHYDVRSEYAKQCGQALANRMDKNVFRSALLGADQASGATVTEEPAGNRYTAVNIATDAAVLTTAIFDFQQDLDENDVPEDGRTLFVRPAQHYLLVEDTTALNADWRGAGSFAEGTLPQIAGIDLVKSNNIPSTDESADATVSVPYRRNNATTVAVGFQRDAVGTVQLIGLQTEGEYDIRRQGHLLVAKYATGHSWLRPGSIGEIHS